MKRILLFVLLVSSLLFASAFAEDKTKVIELKEGGSDVYLSAGGESLLVVYEEQIASSLEGKGYCKGKYFFKGYGEYLFKIQVGTTSRIPKANISCERNFTLKENVLKIVPD